MFTNRPREREEGEKEAEAREEGRHTGGHTNIPIPTIFQLLLPLSNLFNLYTPLITSMRHIVFWVWGEEEIEFEWWG